jgi:replicative DNA helicase
MSADRVPPHSLEAEMAVLGSALVDREALETVIEILKPSDFYAHVHEIVFEVIADLERQEMPVDKITLAEALRHRKKLEHVGGLPYLSKLMDTSPTAASARYYAEIVREKAALRRLIHAGHRITEVAFDGEADTEAAIAQAETAFSQAVDAGATRVGGVSLFEALTDNYAILLDRSLGIAADESIRTAWPTLDKKIGPLAPGEMAIWIASAGSGKSALILQLADFIARHYGDVMVASLEMSTRAVAMRYGAMYGRVSARRQREGDLSETELSNLSRAATIQRDRPMRIYDLQTVARLSDLRRELRLLSRHKRVRALIIDGINFLGDVDAAKGDRSSKNDRLDFVYRSLLRFAKEFGVVVHAVQHVNRDGMSGPPNLKDIRDGGNPEGHAHAIIAPYRPNMVGTADERRQGQFIVLKAREGDAGVVADMEFVGYRSMWLERGQVPFWEQDDTADAEREMNLAFEGSL